MLKQNSIKRIYIGNTNNKLEELCKEYNIELIPFINGIYEIENAKLTAKGIIHYLGNDELDISDYKVLVVGYGNIAYYLCEILDVYEVEYSVLTLNPLENKYLRLNKKNIKNELNAVGFNLIINTIPYNLDWDYSTFKDSKIIDVASKPYGFDIDKIIENKIDYYILSAIPSRYCPYTAAKLLKNTLNFY